MSDGVNLGIEIAADELHEPEAYVRAVASVQNQMLNGVISGVDAKRLTEVLKGNCADMTGIQFDDVMRSRVDPFIGFKTALEKSIPEIDELIAAVKNVDEQRASASEKKRIIAHLRKVQKLQSECRADPAKFFVYVARDTSRPPVPAEGYYAILNLKWFHVEFFDTWSDPDHPYSLIQAPPGHGKTESLAHFVAFRVGHRPSMRVLWLTYQTKKAKREGRRIKKIVRSPRYRALFPEVRVLGTIDGESDTMHGFTLDSENRMSREPTLEVCSIDSSFNGDGYDMLIGDDFCSPDVRRYQSLREETTIKWFAVAEERLRDYDNAEIKIIHTPWHKEDTCGQIIAREKDGKMPRWLVRVDDFRIRDDKQGKAVPIWPERHPTTKLEQKKLSLGPVQYSCNYRLSPDVKEEQLIKHVRFFHSLENSPNTTEHDRRRFDEIAQAERWLSIDPSASTAGHSSYQGVIEGVVLPSGHGLVTAAWSLKLGPVEMQDWIVDRIYSQPSPGYAGILVEAQGGIKGQVSMWESGIREKLAARGVKMPLFVSVNTVTGSHKQHSSKAMRLADCAAMIQEVIFFAGCRSIRDFGGKKVSHIGPIQGSEIERLIRNMRDFHTTVETDGVDALVQWVYHHRDVFSRSELSVIAPINEAPTMIHPLTAKMNMMLANKDKPKDRMAEEWEFIEGR